MTLPFDTHVLVAYVTPTSRSNSFATTFSLREAYALARGVWAGKPQAAFWAGALGYEAEPGFDGPDAASIVDPAGTFYRFTQASSLLGARKIEKAEEVKNG